MAAPSDLIYHSGYVRRIAFLNGQVLHDFHLNMMQKNIAEAIKLKTTQERYDMYLLVSPYHLYFAEPFVNESNKDPQESTSNWNSLEFSITSGSWVSNMLEIPEATNEINLVSNFEDYPEQGAHVNFYYRTGVENEWIPITPDQPVYLTVPKKYFQIKVECLYTGTVRPAVYDYALMWKQEG